MGKTVLMIGAFDVKEKEYHFVRKLVESQGCKVLTMNFGVFGGTDLFPIDIDSAEVARAGGGDISELQKNRDLGAAMKIMAKGVAALAPKLHGEGRFDGVFGMGGTGGTSVITSGMRLLPVGVPKVMVSTVASGNTFPFVGLKDITLIHSVVDVAGLNMISEKVFTEAAGAIGGMVKMDYCSSTDQRPIIAATMFGQTTPCVTRCRDALAAKGYEVLIFHATGTGGRTMEAMVEEGLVYAVLDITTTEWADEVCGGPLTAGDKRLEAPGRAGIPHLIVPGCIDMVNFGTPETIPEIYRHRTFYQSRPTTSLMRTNVEENTRMGEIFARKANGAKGKLAFLIPRQGFSKVDQEGGVFWWPEADRAFISALKRNLRPGIPVVEMDAHINDDVFADRAVQMLMELMVQK